ncbi:GNAT family N-acetyltransferase [Paracoccus sp. (in: a-proteobacteria)]|uniref:GNAT family N-acetyltransferase n=1 Tax=Paracoccus sp. TaxID=267 RepID=UPI003A8A27A6
MLRYSDSDEYSDETDAQEAGLLTSLNDRLDVRGLEARDAPRLAAHLLRLSPADRASRFHAGMSDSAIAAYVAQIDWKKVYIFGAFIRGTLRGVAELVPDQDAKSGEIAVSVETKVQHAGLGRLLVLAAMLAGRRIGATTLRLQYQPGNHTMRSLARDMGARMGKPGECVISLPPVPE